MITTLNNLNYNKYVENTFQNRYIRPVQLHDFLIENYGQFINKIGYSTLGLPIFKLTIGKGPNKILAWTQMHGNESTSTLAFLDFLRLYTHNSHFNKLFSERYQLDLVLMLNPDGSNHWTRENALGIDLNRDFNQSKSEEMSLFKNLLFESDYQLALNCHDQRTIFGNPKSNTPATLSVLAPAIDQDNGINNARNRAIKIIANLYSQANPELQNAITRFDDTYYPSATGDNLQKLNIPTILLEAGHYKNDYDRKKARELFFYALLLIFDFADHEVLENDYKYYEIPSSSKNYRDVVIRNINVHTNGRSSTIDVALQFQEKVDENFINISYVPIISEIGDLQKLRGWKDYNLESHSYKYRDNLFTLGKEAYNLLDELDIDLKIPSSNTSK